MVFRADSFFCVCVLLAVQSKESTMLKRVKEALMKKNKTYIALRINSAPVNRIVLTCKNSTYRKKLSTAVVPKQVVKMCEMIMVRTDEKKTFFYAT